MTGGVEQRLCVGGATFPSAVDYVPTFSVSAGSISSPGTLIKATYVDWVYKLDITIAIKNMQFSTTPQTIYASLPGGYTPIHFGSVLAKEVFQNGPGWYSDIIMQIDPTTPTKEIGVFRQSGNFISGQDTYVIFSGSVWLT